MVVESRVRLLVQESVGCLVMHVSQCLVSGVVVVCVVNT